MEGGRDWRRCERRKEKGGRWIWREVGKLRDGRGGGLGEVSMEAA